MGRRTKIKHGRDWVDGEELDFEPLRETWNEYRCSDGSYVKIRLVVSRIIRLDQETPRGEPIYLVDSSNVLAVTPPSTPSSRS